MKKIKLGRDSRGGILIDKEILLSAGFESTKNPVLISLGEGAAIIKNEGSEQCPMALFSSGVTSADIISSVINKEKKTGVLHFMCDSCEKRIFFTKGEVVFAASTMKEDRLGDILWRNGIISLEAVNEVAGQIGKGGARLGELLMRYGKLKPRDVYVGLTLQIKEIFLSTFLISDGYILFLEFDHKEKNAVRLKESTTDLIAEGFSRSGELGKLRTLVPDPEIRFDICEPNPVVGINNKESAVRDLAARGLTFREIKEECRLGEYETLKAIITLMNNGLVVLSRKNINEGDEHEKRIEQLIGAITLCYRALQDKGPMGPVHLESYLENPPAFEELLGGLSFDSDGRLDKGILMERAMKHYGAAAGERIVEALDALIQYATFEVKNGLNPADAGDVIKSVLALYVE